jgi:hypothetical protein
VDEAVVGAVAVEDLAGAVVVDRGEDVGAVAIGMQVVATTVADGEVSIVLFPVLK